MSGTTAAWQALRTHHREIAGHHLRDMFATDAGRFGRMALTLDDMLVDLSRNAVTDRTLDLLAGLAEDCGVPALRDAMLAGEKINATEGRAVLHTALRAPAGADIRVDGANVVPDVHAVLDAMGAFAEGVRAGSISGATGRIFTDVVNIGIGGSDLGPAMVTLALEPWRHQRLRMHYVSNVDGAHLHDTLKGLDPATTLVLVASKTFTTMETMANAESARGWIVEAMGDTAVAAHFAAISTNIEGCVAFGLTEDRIFGFWEWVGGRYSVWSAIGLPVMIAIGAENFRAFLDGAHAMDRHFATAPLRHNIPVMLAMLGVWHRNVCGHTTHGVMPYDQRLSRFPAYLQQLDMESNGKRVKADGTPVETATGPVVWGEPGTNGQHAFFQLIHQGTDIIPVDFLVAAGTWTERVSGPWRAHHDKLVANALAQADALMKGRTLAEARDQLLAKGVPAAEADRLAPHRVFPGNRPSTTIVYKVLDPGTLGRLIALYEHRVFVQGAVWGVNSYDQWGVELGKELASGLIGVVDGSAPAEGCSPATQGLVAHLHALRAESAA